jgi:hypothetical protein
MLEKIEARLVDDWHKILRFWSVQWAMLGAIILPLLATAPQTLPPEVLAIIPPSMRALITCLWCVMFIVFRAWQQKHPNG